MPLSASDIAVLQSGNISQIDFSTFTFLESPQSFLTMTEVITVLPNLQILRIPFTNSFDIFIDPFQTGLWRSSLNNILQALAGMNRLKEFCISVHKWPTEVLNKLLISIFSSILIISDSLLNIAVNFIRT